MKPLGELESLVMDIVWAGPALTVRDVHARLPKDRQRAYTTVMTTLDRLHQKALLVREKDGIAWRYRAALPRDAFRQALADQLASEILRDYGARGVAAFVDAASADVALLEQLFALVEARRSGG